MQPWALPVFKAKLFQWQEETHVVHNVISVFTLKNKELISKGKVVIAFISLLGCFAGTWLLTNHLSSKNRTRDDPASPQAVSLPCLPPPLLEPGLHFDKQQRSGPLLCQLPYVFIYVDHTLCCLCLLYCKIQKYIIYGILEDHVHEKRQRLEEIKIKNRSERQKLLNILSGTNCQ